MIPQIQQMLAQIVGGRPGMAPQVMPGGAPPGMAPPVQPPVAAPPQPMPPQAGGGGPLLQQMLARAMMVGPGQQPPESMRPPMPPAASPSPSLGTGAPVAIPAKPDNNVAMMKSFMEANKQPNKLTRVPPVRGFQSRPGNSAAVYGGGSIPTQ